MALYTVSDIELSNIAQAIRGRTGNSNQLTFPNDFMTGIGSIGGIRTEEGTFTNGGNASQRLFIHNLNTKKIFGLVWLEKDANNEIIAPGGYTLIYCSFFTQWITNELYNGVTLVQNYTSNNTKTAIYSEKRPLSRLKSTWTNAAAGWNASTLADAYATHANIAEADKNSQFYLVLGSGSGVAYFRTGLTYHYKLWALE